MSDPEEWGEPEPFGEDESGEPVLWNCPNPDCSAQKDTKEKAAAHCADTDEEGGSGGETPGVDADKTTVQNGYYQQNGLVDVSTAVGRLDVDGLPSAQCLGNHDFVGWYQTRPETDVETIEDGFDGRGTVYSLADDYGELASEIDRVLYATTNYQDPDAREWLPYANSDDGKEWADDETPTPGYEDILGFSILADIDLADDHKERPLPSGTRETVERAISEYADSFALLAGGREHVFALDSVGGVYLLTPPAATSPIAQVFDGDARKRIFEELRQRADAWLNNVRDGVNETIPDAEGVFEADLLNQKNRLYKAPLSHHSSIGGVVHPLDIETGAVDPTYEFVPTDDVDETLIDETVKWATEFSHPEHTDAIEPIVARLWPEYVDDADGWQDALESWLSDEREAEAEQQRKAQQAAEERARRREERGDDLPPFTDAAGGDGLGIATNFDDVQAAVSRVDPQQVVRQLCDEYDTDPGRDPPRFEPTYRTSDSGTSCFVDSEKITDLDDEYSAIGVLDYIARERGYIGETDTATGEARGKARDDLRDMGFGIPVYTPVEGSRSYDGDEYDEMPGWARAKAAVVLGVCDPDDVEDGWKLSPTHHDALLDVLEEQGIEHGCDRLKDRGDDENEFIVEQNGKYGRRVDVSDDDEPANWVFFDETNFTLDVNAVLTLDGDEYFDLTIDCVNGEQYQTQVQPTVLNEWRTFKKNIVIGTGTVAGTSRSNEQLLNELRQHLDAQDAPHLTGVERLGIHGNEFVTPDGVLGADGWVDDPEHVYVETGDPIDDALNIAAEAEESDVARIVELLPESRAEDIEQFIPVIGWYYAAAFRPQILDWTGQFNHLAVFGETGAGKTHTNRVVSPMFGMSENGFNTNDTAFVSLATLSGVSGLPVWYDEYKPAEWSERDRRRFHGDLRKAASGQMAYRGNQDLGTDGFRLSAPILLTGEQHLQGSAEQRRTIQTVFTDASPTDAACQQAYKDLRDSDLRAHARLFYQWVLGESESDVRARWEAAGDDIRERLPVDGVDDMAQQGLQTVLFGMKVYQAFADAVGAEPADVPLWDSLTKLCNETGEDSRTSHIEEFVSLLARASVNEYLVEDTHYTFTSGELRVNVSRTHDRVSKFVRDHGLTGVDLFDSSGDYTSRFGDEDAGWVTCVNQNSPPVGRAVGFDTEACPLIERSAFDDEAGADEEKRTAEVDISPIEDLNGGFATITARVNDVERPEPQSAPTQAGRLADATGPVKFVCWGTEPFDLAPDEHYRFENVEVGEYEGNTQVELVEGITNVEAVAAGVGHTEGYGEPLQGERLRAVRDTIGTLCASDDGAEHARREDILRIAGEQGVDESQTENALDKLSNQGDIYQPLTGQYRLND